MSLAFRMMRDTDRAFIAHSWRTSYEGAPAVRGADRDHYRGEMIRLVNRILDKAEVRVACDPNDEDTIVGWVAFERPTFLYGYVKDAFRDDCKLSDMLEGVTLDAYSFHCRPVQQGLVGINGCAFVLDDKSGRTSWTPPKGWRFTPRFTY